MNTYLDDDLLKNEKLTHSSNIRMAKLSDLEKLLEVRSLESEFIEKSGMSKLGEKLQKCLFTQLLKQKEVLFLLIERNGEYSDYIILTTNFIMTAIKMFVPIIFTLLKGDDRKKASGRRIKLKAIFQVSYIAFRCFFQAPYFRYGCFIESWHNKKSDLLYGPALIARISLEQAKYMGVENFKLFVYQDNQRMLMFLKRMVSIYGIQMDTLGKIKLGESSLNIFLMKTSGTESVKNKRHV